MQVFVLSGKKEGGPHTAPHPPHGYAHLDHSVQCQVPYVLCCAPEMYVEYIPASLKYSVYVDARCPYIYRTKGGWVNVLDNLTKGSFRWDPKRLLLKEYRS